MKKITTNFVLLFLLIPYTFYCQDTPILFEVDTESYIFLENSISVNEGEIWGPETQYSISFDFDFEIYGTIYNDVIVDAGKGLTFPGFNARKLWVWVSEWGGWELLKDNGISESESPIDYEIIGEQGSRILIIQWQNAGIREVDGDDDPDDFVDFQIWVCEGTNRLELHYGQSETSSLSFGYNAGPGCRFFNIEDDWGICIWGYPNLPSWDWVEFIGPYGGCLLSGVPDENKVYNFYPNPNVSIKEQNDTNQLNFFIINKYPYDGIQVLLTEFNPHKKYKLEVINMLGIKIIDIPINNQNTYLNQSQFKDGIYIFNLKDDYIQTSQKILLR